MPFAAEMLHESGSVPHILLTFCLAVNVAAGIWYFGRFTRSQAPEPDRTLESALNNIADDYRRIIVLMDGAESLDAATGERCLNAGRQLFYRKQHAIGTFTVTPESTRQLIRYLSDNTDLHDADKLAFTVLEDVQAAAEPASPLTESLKPRSAVPPSAKSGTPMSPICEHSFPATKFLPNGATFWRRFPARNPSSSALRMTHAIKRSCRR